jgi:hypothetical protein
LEDAEVTPCKNGEEVVRAVQLSHYDENRGRVSSALFRGNNISVSRLHVLTFEAIWASFLEEVDKPHNRLVGARLLVVRDIVQTGASSGTPLTVYAKPTPTNQAHAEISAETKISRKVAHALIQKSIEVATPA